MFIYFIFPLCTPYLLVPLPFFRFRSEIDIYLRKARVGSLFPTFAEARACLLRTETYYAVKQYREVTDRND
jgi:hypothetical protein